LRDKNLNPLLHFTVESAAYKSFGRFVFCESPLGNKGIAAAFLTKIIREELTWHGYQLFMQYVQKELAKEPFAKNVAKQREFKDFLITTLPLIAKKLSNHKERTEFIELVENMAEKAKAEDPQDSVKLYEFAKEVGRIEIDANLAETRALGEKVKALQFPASIDRDVARLNGYDDNKLYKEFSEKAELSKEGLKSYQEGYYNRARDLETKLEQVTSIAADEFYYLVNESDAIRETVEMNVKTFDKALGDMAKEVAAQVNQFEMSHRTKNNGLNQRYQKLLLQQQQLATNLPIISQQLAQRKQAQVNELTALAGRDPENIKKTIEVLESHIKFFQQAIEAEDDYLKKTQVSIEKLYAQANQLLAENSSALLKDQLSKLNEFEQNLQFVESSMSPHEQKLTVLQTKVNETFLISDKVIQGIKAREAENLATYQAIQANYQSVLSQEQEITVTLSEPIEKLRREKDQLFAAIKLEQLAIEQKDQAVFLQSRQIAEDAFKELDQLFSQREKLIKENEAKFTIESEKAGQVFTDTKIPLAEQEEKITEFSRTVKNMEQEIKINSQQEQIKVALEQTRLVLDQQVAEIEQAFNHQITLREEQEEKLALSIADKIKAGQALAEQIDNDKEQHEWLVKELKLFKEHIELIPKDKQVAEVSLGDLAIRATAISQMLDAVEQERDLSKQRLPVEIRDLKHLAKEMLPRVSEYGARLQKILVDQQGARSRAEFALGLFDNWFFSKLPFVVELKKFIEEQKGLEKQITQITAMEERISALSNKELEITGDNLTKLSEDLIDDIVYLEREGRSFAKGASAELLNDEIQKARLATKVVKEGKKVPAETASENWLLAEIDDLAENGDQLIKRLGQVRESYVICHEDQKTIGTAKAEQARLARLSQQIKLVADEGQLLQAQVDKTKSELTNLRTAKNIFSGQKADQRYQAQLEQYREKLVVAGKKSEPSTSPLIQVLEADMPFEDKKRFLTDLITDKPDKPGSACDINEVINGQTLLCRAVEQGSLNLVKFLVEELKADVNKRDGEYGVAPLHKAVEKADLGLVKFLGEHGADVNALHVIDSENKKAITPLSKALIDTQPQIVSYLRTKDATVNRIELNSLLILRVQEEDIVAVKLLLQEKVNVRLLDVNAKDQAPEALSRTALHYAVETGNKEIVKLLLANGARISVQDETESTPLHYAVRANNVELVKVLLTESQHILRLRIKNQQGKAALDLAVDEENVGSVKLLVEKGADLDAISQASKNKFLQRGVKEGDSQWVMQLLRAGAEISGELWLLALQGYVAAKEPDKKEQFNQIISVFIAKKAPVNIEAKDKDGNNILHLAAKSGHVEALTALRSRAGVFGDIAFNSFNEKNLLGDTPLQVAIGHGQLAAVEMLLSVGVQVNVTDAKGETPLHLVVEKNHPKVIEQLLKLGANVNATNSRGETALHLAIAKGEIGLVKLLLDGGARIGIRRNKGEEKEQGETALSTEEGKKFLLRLVEQAADKQGNTESQQVLKVLLAREKEEKIHNAGNPTVLFLVHELLSGAEEEKKSQVIKHLVAAGAKIEVVGQDAEGNHVLHRMCRQGELKLVKELIGSWWRPGYLLNAQNELGETVLHAAMGDQDNIADIRLVEYLLNRDESLLEQVNKEGKKAFETERGQRVFERVRDTRSETSGERVYENLYQLLVKKGVESAYEKALEHQLESLRRVKTGVVEKESDRKYAEMDEKEKKKLTESDAIGSPSSVQKIFENYEAGTRAELLMVKAKLAQKNRNYLIGQNEKGETLLHRAVLNSDLEILKFMKEQSKEQKRDWLKLLNTRNHAGETPLHVAVRNKKLEMAKWLLEEGIDKWQVDNKGQTAWSLTLENRHVGLIGALIGSGEMPVAEVIGVVEFSSQDSSTKQLWMEVLRSGLFKHKETVVNGRDRNGETLLHAAIKRNDVEDVDYLLSCGADVTIRGKGDKEKGVPGETAFELAQKRWQEKQETASHIVQTTVSEVKGDVKSLFGMSHEVEREKEQKIYELLRDYRRNGYGHKRQKLLFTHTDSGLSDLRKNYLLQLGRQTSSMEGLDELSREGIAKRAGANKELADQVRDRQDASQNLMKMQDRVRKVVSDELILQDPVSLLKSYAGVLSKYVVLLNKQVLTDQERGVESKEYKEGMDLLFDKYELVRKELERVNGGTEKVTVEFDKLLLGGQELEAIIKVVYKDITLLKNRLLEMQHEEKRAPWYRSKLGDLMLHRLVKTGELTREHWEEKNKENNLLGNVINTPTLGNGYTALQLAIAYGASGLAEDKSKSLEMVQLLLEKGADVNAHQSKELDSNFKETGKLRVMEPALNIAVQVDNPWVFSCLLERKELDVNAVDEKGETALHLLASRKDAVGLELTKLLLQANPNLGLKNKAGKTALDLGKLSGNEEFVKLVQSADKKRQRPGFGLLWQKEVERERIVEPGLISAIKSDALLLAKLLLERKELDVNVSDKSGETALHLLASRKDQEDQEVREDRKDIAAIELLKLLLERDANFRLPNKQGKTALQVATESNNRDFVLCCKEKDQGVVKDTREITGVTDFFSQDTGVKSSFSGSFKELRSRLNKQKREEQEGKEPRQPSNDDKSQKLQ